MVDVWHRGVSARSPPLYKAPCARLYPAPNCLFHVWAGHAAWETKPAHLFKHLSV